MLAWALFYASIGWSVFPLTPASKTPSTKRGFKDATTDTEKIRAWWEARPDANVGLACGGASGFVVLDVDPRNGGELALQALEAEHGELPATVTAQTGGGGQHYVFALPEGRLRKTLCNGVDVQGTGQYIVAPPSVHPDGGRYEWLRAPDAASTVLLPPPGWVLDLIVKPEPAPTGVPSGSPAPAGASPGTSWADILEPHGWVAVAEDGEETYWRRPGKDDGVSATTNYEGNGILIVFTTSTDFEAGAGYRKVDALAILKYGGDYGQAASELRLRDPLSALAPKVYAFEPAFPPEHFVSRYVAWAGSHTDAPTEYHEAMALALLAHTTAGTRAMLSPYPHGLPLNLYLILCGGTTRTRKSTAQNLGTSLLEVPGRPMPGWRLPTRTTPEAMIEDMAERDGLAALWTPDEFGVTLSQIYRRDFLRGLEELLLTFYGGERYKLRTLNRETSVNMAHLTVVGAATPESLALAGPGMTLGGLLPRFGVVFPRVLPDHVPAGATPDLGMTYRVLAEELRMMFMNVGKNITFAEAALVLLNEGEERLATQKHSLRLPIMLYKVAALGAVGRGETFVTVADAESAIIVVDRWADGAAHLSSFLSKKTQDFEFERIIEDAIEYMESVGGTCLRTELASTLRVRERVMREVAETLHGRGRLVITQGADGGEVWSLQ